MCNAAATLDFGKVPVGAKSGSKVNVGEYLKHNWDTEEWARPYFVQTMGKMSLEDAPKDFREWAKAISEDYEPARCWFESEFMTQCMEPRMQPEKSNDLDLMECRSQQDCDKDRKYDGGCCMRTSIAWGHDMFEKSPTNFKESFERLQKDDTLGFCAPKVVTDYMDSQDDKKTNFWDYERHLFSTKEFNELFFKDWPADVKRPGNFEGWVQAIEKDYPGVYDWKEWGFESQCLAGNMWGDMDWPDMDIDVDMRDDGMTISMEGMTIEMKEGEDGSGSMRIVMESATKLAVSGLALASLALF